MRASNEGSPRPRVARAQGIARPPSFSSIPLLQYWREWPRPPFTARIERAPFHRARSASTETMLAVSPLPFQARSFTLQGWRLIDLPLRASNEGLLRPRVARAQKIISLHPLLCSASKKDTWPNCPARHGYLSWSFSFHPIGRVVRVTPTAAVERAHSDRARSGSTGVALTTLPFSSFGVTSFPRISIMRSLWLL